METETTFFQSDDVKVTNARFIVGSQTFVMRGITSVEAIQIPASYNGPGALCVIGVIIVVAGFMSSQFVVGGIGTAMLALGVWLFTRQKPVFAVVLRTAGGEVTAYQSYEWNYISQIIAALNRSIISRG